ncbi:MAG: UTRA domain-containing protein [Hyphomicrobiales bacterium]|nr:UTRA domain-containing protein [Hyphomicrobiales bacterium]
MGQGTRLFRRQGHTAFLETETVIAERCSDPLTDTGYRTTKHLQKQRYSPLGHTADIVIRMRVLDLDEAELLGLMPYQAGIEQEQLVRDKSGSAFCFSRRIWRGEIVQFSARAILNH